MPSIDADYNIRKWWSVYKTAIYCVQNSKVTWVISESQLPQVSCISTNINQIAIIYIINCQNHLHSLDWGCFIMILLYEMPWTRWTLHRTGRYFIYAPKLMLVMVCLILFCFSDRSTLICRYSIHIVYGSFVHWPPSL